MWIVSVAMQSYPTLNIKDFQQVNPQPDSKCTETSSLDAFATFFFL